MAGQRCLRLAASARSRNLSLSLGQNRIAGDLVLDENFLPLGTVNFQLPDVGALAALALETVKGDLNGTISFTDNAGKPELAVRRDDQGDLARRHHGASNVAIDATVNDYLSAPAVSGRVRAATVTSGKTVVRDIDVTLTRDGAWTGFDGGATVSDIPARAAGRVQVANGRTVIELASGQATVRGLQARLARASEDRDRGRHDDARQGRARRRRRHRGGVGNGRLGAQSQRDAVGGAGVAGQQLCAGPRRSRRTISGTARVTGAAANPAVGYSIDWRGAQTAQTRSAGFRRDAASPPAAISPAAG